MSFVSLVYTWKYSVPFPKSLYHKSEVPETGKRQISHPSSRSRRRIWGARGWSIPTQYLEVHTANPLTSHFQTQEGQEVGLEQPTWTYQGQIMPFQPEHLWWYDWLCGWKERSGNHIPWLQQGLWHCVFQYLYCPTSEIRTG